MKDICVFDYATFCEKYELDEVLYSDIIEMLTDIKNAQISILADNREFPREFRNIPSEHTQQRIIDILAVVVQMYKDIDYPN
jgi:hypothetical protein